MNNLFVDEISLSLLNLGANLTIVRKLIRNLKRDIDEKGIVKSESDFEIFKEFEQANIQKSIDAVKLCDNKFIKYRFKINPYLIFTESNISQRGFRDNSIYDILLQPNFIPCNTFHYVPTYLIGEDKNLVTLKTKYKCDFCYQEVYNMSSKKEDEIINILKSFLLKQYILISDK